MPIDATGVAYSAVSSLLRYDPSLKLRPPHTTVAVSDDDDDFDAPPSSSKSSSAQQKRTRLDWKGSRATVGTKTWPLTYLRYRSNLSLWMDAQLSKKERRTGGIVSALE